MKCITNQRLDGIPTSRLIDWKETFDAQPEPSSSLEDYPQGSEVRAKFDEARANTLAFLDGISDTDLETPTSVYLRINEIDLPPVYDG